MRNFKSIVFFSLCFLLTSSLYAQEDADKLYDNLGFKTAIPKLEQRGDMNLPTMVRIANSYRLNNDTYNAELWYSQVVQKSTEPINYLYYAQALQSNGKSKDAKTYFLLYNDMIADDSTDEVSDRRGIILAAAIDRMNDFSHTEVVVKNEKNINSAKLDFSPTYYKNGILFVSSRGKSEGKDDEAKDIWIDDNFMDLFYVEKTIEGNLEAPKLFSSNLSSRYHEGPVTFNKAGDKIFFTRNNFNKGKRKNNSKGVMKLQIYSANKKGEEWENIEELSFNTVENEECHPSLSADGTKLYFASDRPGGYGGMDIYLSKFEGGKWSAPINLGENINTPGNEVFPFIHDDGTIYFASNGLAGLGGLDIFSTMSIGDSIWNAPNNIGTPFNSKQDDFGFIMNVLGTEGYFTSSRENGVGNDDIYSFVLPKAMAKKIKAKVCAYNETNNDKLSNVKVTVIETMHDEMEEKDYMMELVQTENEKEFILKMRADAMKKNERSVAHTTNEEGHFMFDMLPNKEYKFTAKKDGYLLAEKSFSTKNLANNEMIDFCIPLEVNTCLILEGVVKNKKYGKMIPNASVTMLNLCTGEESKVSSDKNGNFEFPCMECDCEYVIKGNKSQFTEGVSSTSTLGMDCDSGGKITTVLQLIPPEIPRLEKRVIAATTTVPTNEASVFKQGMVIELEKIYYDFNKSYIREGAAEELDDVVSLLEKYPSMTIELSSHTDCRGGRRYNQQLSQKRANAAVEYIISRGIDRSRLVAKGYGKFKLRNHCEDGVECTEEEHQYNRRTEIKVLKFDNKNVKVRYINNAPEKIDPADPNRKIYKDK